MVVCVFRAPATPATGFNEMLPSDGISGIFWEFSVNFLRFSILADASESILVDLLGSSLLVKRLLIGTEHRLPIERVVFLRKPGARALAVWLGI
jgi:hypothetical protein